MAVAELTIFGRRDIEAIMRDIIVSDPEAKSLFGMNNCSLHCEPFLIFSLMREPMVVQLIP